MAGRVQVDDIKVGCVREGAAAEAPKPQNNEFAAGKAAVRLREFRGREIAERDQRPFGDPGIAFRHFERVAAKIDQLDSEREPPFVDEPSHPVEGVIVRLPLHRALEQLREAGRVGGHLEAGGIEQPLEQLGAPAELLGQRRSMGEQLRQELCESGPSFEKPEQIDPTRKALDDVAQAVEGVVRVSPGGNRPEQRRKHGLERLLRRRRAKRASPARTPVGDMAGRRACIREAELRKLRAQEVGIAGKLPSLVRFEAVEDRPGSFDVRGKLADQFRARRHAMELREIVQRLLVRRKKVSLRIVDHLHAVLDRPQQAIGIREFAGGLGIQPCRLDQSGDRVEGCGGAH